MSETLTRNAIENLSQFIGYGRLDAPIWFLGLEESLGKRPSMSGWSPFIELKIRAKWAPVLDVKQAHQTLHDDYWNRKNYSAVWRFMTKLSVGILYPQISWSDNQVVHKYVIRKLGRKDGDTLLGEIMPFPAKNMSDWPFASVYVNREEYLGELLPKRLQLWNTLLSHHRPSVIFAYGKRYWPYYLKLFGLDNWRQVTEKIETKRIKGGIVYLMPFFGNGQLSNQDVADVIKDVRVSRN